MKKLYVLLALCFLMLTACESNDSGGYADPPDAGSADPAPLRLAPYLHSSRAAINYEPSDYFGISEEYGRAGISVVLKGETSDTISYTYDNGTLEAENGNGFYFPENGGIFDRINVIWPDADVRNSAGDRVPADQSERSTFLGADWLSGTLNNIRRAGIIPVVLQHERCKVTFISEGHTITSLEVGGYNAFCDTAKGVAQLILANGDSLSFALGTVGELTLAGEDEVRFFSLESQIVLDEGVNYTYKITLS